MVDRIDWTNNTNSVELRLEATTLARYEKAIRTLSHATQAGLIGTVVVCGDSTTRALTHVRMATKLFLGSPA
jgi:hypothetical protein